MRISYNASWRGPFGCVTVVDGWGKGFVWGALSLGEWAQDRVYRRGSAHKRFLAVQVTRLSRIHIDWTWVGVDAVLVSLAWLGALVLRYDVDIVANVSSRWFAYLPIWSGTALACNVVAGVYSGVWRQASVYEARRVLFASGVCSAALLSVVAFQDPRPIPLSVPVLAGLLSAALVGTLRFQPRLRRQRHTGSGDVVRMVVVGAGNAGEALVADAQKHSANVRVVALLDDDPGLRGRRVHGVPVAGTIDDLPVVVHQLRASTTVLAVPSAGAALVRRVASLAERAECVMRVIPRSPTWSAAG